MWERALASERPNLERGVLPRINRASVASGIEAFRQTIIRFGIRLIAPGRSLGWLLETRRAGEARS